MALRRYGEYAGFAVADWQEAHQPEPRLKPKYTAFVPVGRQCEAADTVLMALWYVALAAAG